MGIRTVYTPDELFQFYERMATYLSEISYVNQPLESYLLQYFQRFPTAKPIQIPVKEISNYLFRYFPQKLIRFTTTKRHQSAENDIKTEKCAKDVRPTTSPITKTLSSGLNISTFCYDYFFNFSSSGNGVESVFESPIKIDRRTALYKRSHRARNALHEYIAIDCTEADLPTYFPQVADEIFTYCKSAADCYQLILNSLARFYSTKTWSTNTQNCVATFLRKHFTRDGSEICCETLERAAFASGPSDDETLCRMQTDCLLELFCAKVGCRAITNLHIMDTLYAIRYIYGEGELRKFISDCLVRKFVELLPDDLQTICDTFGVPMVRPKRRLGNADATRSLTAGAGQRLKSPEKKRRRKRFSSCDSMSKPLAFSLASTLRTNDAGQRTRVAPTPMSDDVSKLFEESDENDENASNNVDEDVEDEEDEAIVEEEEAEEPGEESSGSYSNDAILRNRIFGDMPTDFSAEPPPDTLPTDRRVANLGRSRGGRTSTITPKAVTRRASAASERHCTTSKISSFLKKDHVPCYRRIDSSSDDDKTKASLKQQTQDKVGSRCRKRTSESKALPTTAEVAKRRPSATPAAKLSKVEKPVKLAPIFLPRNVPVSAVGSPAVVEANTAAAILSDSTIVQYKQKMEAIRSNARSLKNNQEVFYGRSNSRKGLFDNDEDEGGDGSAAAIKPSTSAVTTRRSAESARSAKNRSGRTINAPPVNSIFVAHTLLNVRNMRPLSPFKASQIGAGASAEFRLRKFVKPANRAERRRIQKMKKSGSSHIFNAAEEAAGGDAPDDVPHDDTVDGNATDLVQL